VISKVEKLCTFNYFLHPFSIAHCYFDQLFKLVMIDGIANVFFFYYRIQAEYATTEEKIRFAMRAEQHAKAETQMWRARLEKLSHEHREQLLRHANTLRIRLRKAESLLYFHQLKSERIGKSNMKLKGR